MDVRLGSPGAWGEALYVDRRVLHVDPQDREWTGVAAGEAG